MQARGRPTTSDDLFKPVSEAFQEDRSVSKAKMFGAVGLKVAGKVFAMLVKGQLVVKLPNQRVESIVASKKGSYFDPGHGKLMTEWVAVRADRKSAWVKLATEARDFVRRTR
ncbi:MAG: TfoX/Sxy family protein [Armatimonadota bacterium]